MANKELPETKKVLDFNTRKIKEELKNINEKKEIWFKKKEDLKEDIKKKIREARSIKSTKDKKNIELQEFKKKRDKTNDEVKKLISEIKELNKEKQKLFKKYNITFDPSKIRRQIDELEKQVEQEASFSKEKKLMEKIKALKRTYSESAGAFEVANKAKDISNKIDIAKKKMNEITEKISSIGRDSNYDSFLNNVKEVNALKKEQEDAFQKFIDYKNEYNRASMKLKAAQSGINKKRKEEYKQKTVSRARYEENKNKILKENADKVEEKIKGKKRLTTEDIIAYQGKDFLEK